MNKKPIIRGKVEIEFEILDGGQKIKISHVLAPSKVDLTIGILSAALNDLTFHFNEKHRENEPDCNCFTFRFSSQIETALQVIHDKLAEEKNCKKSEKVHT